MEFMPNQELFTKIFRIRIWLYFKSRNISEIIWYTESIFMKTKKVLPNYLAQSLLVSWGVFTRRKPLLNYYWIEISWLEDFRPKFTKVVSTFGIWKMSLWVNEMPRSHFCSEIWVFCVIFLPFSIHKEISWFMFQWNTNF